MTLSTTNKVNKSVFHKLTHKGVCGWGDVWSLGRESQQGFGKAGGGGRRHTRKRQTSARGSERPLQLRLGCNWRSTRNGEASASPLRGALLQKLNYLISVELVQEEGKHAQGRPQRLTPNTRSSAEG